MVGEEEQGELCRTENASAAALLAMHWHCEGLGSRCMQSTDRLFMRKRLQFLGNDTAALEGQMAACHRSTADQKKSAVEPRSKLKCVTVDHKGRRIVLGDDRAHIVACAILLVDGTAVDTGGIALKVVAHNRGGATAHHVDTPSVLGRIVIELAILDLGTCHAGHCNGPTLRGRVALKEGICDRQKALVPHVNGPSLAAQVVCEAAEHHPFSDYVASKRVLYRADVQDVNG